MTLTSVDTVRYQELFKNQTILCNNYVLTRLGIDRSHCMLKLDDYMLLFAPYQLSFNRAVLLTSLSKQEIIFFQRFKNSLVGVSMEFMVPTRQEPLKMFIRGSLVDIAPMQGRENVGLLTVDFRTTPEAFINILGEYMEGQQRNTSLYDEYGKVQIKLNPTIAKLMGYNQYAILNDAEGAHRIQLFSLSAKNLEHLEGSKSPLRPRGTNVNYQLFFQKYRIQVNAKVDESSRLPTGIIRTKASIAYSPELIEIIEEYLLREKAAQRNANQSMM